MLNNIINRLNQRIEAANIFDQIFGLSELVDSDSGKKWATYIGNGQLQHVTGFDAKQGTLFWGKRGRFNINRVDSFRTAGCQVAYDTRMLLTAYAVVRKSHLPCDSADAADWIASRVFKVISGFDPQFKTALKVVGYEVIPNGYTSDIKSLPDNFEFAKVAIEIDVSVITQSADACYDICDTGDIPLPDFEPCTPCLTQVAVDGETIIGNGTPESPLIALGGGGGGSLRIQDEGTTVSNAATTINFTGEGVTASLTSPGLVEVNVPASAGGGVESVSGNLVDNTDPLNPVIDAAISSDAGNDLTLGSDGLPYYQDSGSAVISVNGQTGDVSLDTDDIPDTATNRYTNDTDITRLANTSGTNTGDQDLSGLVPYTGATGDVDLGARKLAAQAVNVTGVNGNGFIHLRHQASNASATGQTTSVFADSNGNIKLKNDGLSYATFATNGITNDRTYTFPDKSGTVAMTSDLPPSSEAIVISGNTTAANDSTYHVIASAIFTDPTGVNGKGYMVLVRNGTATVGGVAYTQAGTIIYRIFHSGSWQNYAQQPISYFKSTANGTSVTGTTAQTITYAQLIPAGTYTTGDIVRISFRSLKSGTAGNLTGRVQVNTANSLSGALGLVGAGAGAFRYVQLLTHLVIKSATVTEIAFTNTVRITDIVQTSELAVNLNINWAVDQWILFTVQNGSTADTSNGSFFLIEKI